MAAVPQIILDSDGAGPIMARIEFNGVFLAQENFTTPVRRSMRINGWVLDGVNHLQVRLVAASRPLPPPELQLEPPQRR